jgi:uroporphyrin-III C-methyltransferase
MTRPHPESPFKTCYGQVIDHSASIQSPAPRRGKCTLVGAGPGDPELLTVKAVKAIQSATVLLVDDLVSPAVVALASPGARVIWVGKRGGCASTPQTFIEKLILVAVREGEQVVRLKGGTLLCLAAVARNWPTCAPKGWMSKWSTASPQVWPA